jgi:hypothetical protein
MAKKKGAKKKKPAKSPAKKNQQMPSMPRKKKINGIEAAGGRGAY